MEKCCECGKEDYLFYVVLDWNYTNGFFECNRCGEVCESCLDKNYWYVEDYNGGVFLNNIIRPISYKQYCEL